MHEQLFAMRGYPLNDQQKEFIRSVFHPLSFSKGQVFQRAGNVATRGAFVAKGLFRTYASDESGKEGIVHFSPERSFIGDIDSARSSRPTTLTVQAIEPSEVLTIDLPSFELLLDKVPAIARGYRIGLEKSNAAREKRIALHLNASAEVRYRMFVEGHPDLAARVPQHMLASYLGITPETLSRVRSRMNTGPTKIVDPDQ